MPPRVRNGLTHAADQLTPHDEPAIDLTVERGERDLGHLGQSVVAEPGGPCCTGTSRADAERPEPALDMVAADQAERLRADRLAAGFIASSSRRISIVVEIAIQHEVDSGARASPSASRMASA